ncbi:type II secretion system protein N [Hyphococcus sp.]|uniref:type II secretion system protein N n=1 Tax=Hyphococcus sp. TaxID=2038636 RepID=UPI003CCC3006
MSDNGVHKKNQCWLGALGLLSFFITACVVAPASMLAKLVDVENRNVAFAAIEGTLWRGSIANLSINNISLGNVDFQLAPLSLLTLSPRITLNAEGGDVFGSGVISYAPSAKYFASNVNAQINLGATATSGVLGQPVEGSAELFVEQYVFTESKGCIKAAGAVWTDVLNAPSKRYDLPELPLSGELHCEEGATIIKLSGENVRAGTDVLVRIFPNLTYEVTAKATPSEAEVASALRYFGFEDQNGALIYGAAGVFKGPGS